MCHFQIPMSPSTFRMNDSLRDSFSVKLGEFVNKMEVLQKDGASGTSSKRILVVVNGMSPAGSQSFSLHLNARY
jgi:hypothetical protein